MHASENKNSYHPFLVDRFKKSPILSGMPESDKKREIANLSHNLNHFASSQHRDYPHHNTSALAKQYIKFLKSELKSEQCTRIDFLKEENLYFASITKAIYLIIKAFCIPNIDEIGVLDPTFPLYEFIAKDSDILVNKIKLEGENLNKIPTPSKSQINSKCIFICNPNNPTGTYIDESNIIKWLDTGMLVAIDEAYIEYSKAKSAVNLLRDYPNLIIMRTFSKAWGMAGIRSGVIISSNPIIRSLNRADIPFEFSSLAQNAVCDLLSQINLTQKIKEKNKRQRELLTSELKRMSFVKKIYPSETCFVFLKVKDSKSFEDFLLENNISTNTQLSQIPNTIRISIGDKDLNSRLISLCTQYDINRSS